MVLKKKSKKRTNTGVESKNRNISKASRVSEQSSIGSEGFDIQINQIENVSVAKEH